jgi:hypothetical protein
MARRTGGQAARSAHPVLWVVWEAGRHGWARLVGEPTGGELATGQRRGATKEESNP